MRRRTVLGAAIGAAASLASTVTLAQATDGKPADGRPALTLKQTSIAPIGAAMAVGDIPQLTSALNAGLDAGLTVAEVKEVLVNVGLTAEQLLAVVDTLALRGQADAARRLRAAVDLAAPTTAPK